LTSKAFIENLLKVGFADISINAKLELLLFRKILLFKLMPLAPLLPPREALPKAFPRKISNYRYLESFFFLRQ